MECTVVFINSIQISYHYKSKTSKLQSMHAMQCSILQNECP